MEDDYFKNMADKITIHICNKSVSDGDFSETRHQIYLTLKEVAKDQRYACVDAIVNYIHSTGGSFIDSMCSTMRNIIQNS